MKESSLTKQQQKEKIRERYKGVDPEVSLGGLAPGMESTSYYPRTRTFTLGVNMNF